VLTIPRSVRILIGSTPVDMRKSIDGLMGIVKDALRENPYSGHLFVFVSRRCDRVKVLTWDKSGFVLVYKRLERGRFKLPHVDPSTMAVEIDATQLAMLLDGIDFGWVPRPEHWKPHPRWIVRPVVPWTNPLRHDLCAGEWAVAITVASGETRRKPWRPSSARLGLPSPSKQR
jgi:transposase